MILNTVKRSNLYLILLSVIALVIVGVVTYLWVGPYFIARFTGPTKIDPMEIAAMNTYSPTLYFRQVTGDRMRDTYYYEETVNEDTGSQISIDAYFGALEIISGKWLLIRNPDEINPREMTYVGALTPITDNIAVEVSQLAAQEMNISFMPVMLDAKDDPIGWYIGAAVLGVTTLGGIWGVVNFVIRSSNPYAHPNVKKLARFGDPATVISEIENEMVLAGNTGVGKLIMGNKWMIHKTGSSVQAMPYQDIIWLYKNIINNRGVKTYYAHFCDRHGVEINILAKEKEVDAMLTAVFQAAPWAIAGYDQNVKNAWSKDRASLIQVVDERLAQHRAQSRF